MFFEIVHVKFIHQYLTFLDGYIKYYELHLNFWRKLVYYHLPILAVQVKYHVQLVQVAHLND